MPNHNGLTFAQEAAASHRSYSAVFNSSVPQRQQESAKAAYGRVLGPQAYHVPGPVWAHQVDIRHQTSAFASKTNKSKESRPITADVDFVNKPAMISAFRSEAPGTRSLPWGVLEQRPVARRDKQYDGFLDPDVGTKQSLGTSVGASARGYAASFKSVDNRFKFKEGSKLGPGSYEAQGSVQVHDPKRQSHAFRSTLKSTFKEGASNEPPDSIHSPQQAAMARTWTSKGFAFSTRERFPRVRPHWSYG